MPQVSIGNHSRRRPPRAIEYCPSPQSPQPLRLGGGASVAHSEDDAASDAEDAEDDERFDVQYLGPLARDSAPKTVPVRLHELVVLARTTFPREKVELLVGRTQGGDWPPSEFTPMQRYRIKALYASYKWRVRQLPYNRFEPRIVRPSDDAEDSTSEESSGGSDSNDSDDSDSSDDNEDGSDDSDSSDIRGGRVSRSHKARRVGRAADGSRDSEMESVLFVRAASRSADALDAKGQRLGERTWYEVVPTERISDVLQSLWHVGGIQSLSAAKTYARVRELYVGISLEAVASFVRRQEAAQLARSNLTSDKILAPRLPQAVNETWYSDLTFLSADIPVAAPSGGTRFIGFLSVLDSLSRFTWTVPVRDKSAATIAAAHESIVLGFGAPRVLVQDNAQENSGYSMGKLAQR